MNAPDLPVFSRADVDPFTPPGSPRTYDIAPLTVRERNAARAEVVAEAGIYPPQQQLYACMRDVLRDVAPADLDQLLALLDEAEAATPTGPGEDLDAHIAVLARIAPIESACMNASSYRSLLAQRTRYMDSVPFVYARHALRGWSGPQLPEFRRERGLVPFALLDVLPEDEMKMVGLRAFTLSQPNVAAVGKSAGPSQSSETRKASRARSSRSAAGATSSRAKKSKATRA